MEAYEYSKLLDEVRFLGEIIMKKEIKEILDTLDSLRIAAEHVSYKFGTNDDNIPSDYSEWIELRRQILLSTYTLKKYNAKNKIN